MYPVRVRIGLVDAHLICVSGGVRRAGAAHPRRLAWNPWRCGLITWLVLASSACLASKPEAAAPESARAETPEQESSNATAKRSGPRAKVPDEVARVAALQYEIRGDRSLSTILSDVDNMIQGAAGEGAELVVLPELFVLDVWPPKEEDESAFVRKVAADTTPTLLNELQSISAREDVAVLAGSVPELRGESLFNTAHLFFPDGRSVRQDKMFLTAWGLRVGMTPGTKLKVFESPWGRSVILICYDVEFPSLSQKLVQARPEVILVPSMTESTYGYHRVRWAAQARAVEHHAYVVLVGTVGRPHPKWSHFGQAAFITPQDQGFAGILAEGPLNEPGTTFADLDLAKLRASRTRTYFYPARDELSTANVGPGVPAKRKMPSSSGARRAP